MFAGQSVEEQYADALKLDALPEVQETIDKASGRAPSAATVAELDTLDQRIKDYLESQRGGRGHARAGTDPDEPWTAPAPTDGPRRFMVPRRRGEHSEQRRPSLRRGCDAPTVAWSSIGSRA
jgi:hypothetical protein